MASNFKECASPMEEGISGNKRKERVNMIRSEAKRFVQDIALPKLKALIAKELKDGEWALLSDHDDSEGQTFLFEYPTNKKGKGGVK